MVFPLKTIEPIYLYVRKKTTSLILGRYVTFTKYEQAMPSLGEGIEDEAANLKKLFCPEFDVLAAASF
jgi:hypothetical protein